MNEQQSGAAHVAVISIVTIAGAVATVVFGGASKYILHSKTAEATRNLGSIETGEKNKFQQETDSSPKEDGTGPFVHTFCPSSKAVPAGVPKGVKVKVDSKEWDEASWKCLKFSINEAQFYQYKAVANGASGTAAMYTARVNGDLDGDGVLSTFQLVGQGTTTGDASRVSLTITNEDE